jgi:UDP-N-acetylmuramoyl-tripeptide--D-alanyl-D-alanine ligase
MLISNDFLRKALQGAFVKLQGKEGNDFADLSQVDLGEREVDVSCDSRTINPGDFFIALKGARVDGHAFVEQALDNGATGLIISDEACLHNLSKKRLQDCFILKVSNTLQALTSLAVVWRSMLSIPLVGITGSIGKTSTKEIVKNILVCAGIDAFVSYKNQNSTIGLPLNILRVQQHHKIAVFELGVSEQGEMEKLADMLRPTLACITCIAHSHAKGLGNIQDICYEKRFIFKYFGPSDVGIIFGDQEVLTHAFYTHPIAKFGYKTRNQVQARKVQYIEAADGTMLTEFILKWYGKKSRVVLPNNHSGLVANSLAASTLAYFLDIPFEAVVNGLETYGGFENRFEIKPLADKRGMMISDCYNANPESMKAALVAFNQMKKNGPKIAVLGDMLELGEKEIYWHRQIGRILNRMDSIDSVILVGQRAWEISQTAPPSMNIVRAADWQEATVVLQESLGEHAVMVLVKGSLGMQLGKMVDNFIA